MYVDVTEEDVQRVAEGSGMSAKEVYAAVQEARWGEAREWLADIRSWIDSIKRSTIDNTAEIRKVLAQQPPDIITGHEHIDYIVNVYATRLLQKRVNEHVAAIEFSRAVISTLPPKRHLNRTQIRNLVGRKKK